MTIYAGGDPQQVQSIASDAARIGVPKVARADDRSNFSELLSADQLDYFTAQSLNTKGGSSRWEPGKAATTSDLLFARQRVDEEPGWLSVAYLLNLSLYAPTALERTAAAQALDALSEGRNWRAQDVLRGAISSQNPVAATIAAPALPDREPPEPPTPMFPRPRWEPYPRPAASRGPKSLAIHGTWARIAKRRWYAPGDELHDHIAADASPATMYLADDYFRWSGSYTRAAREQGATRLRRWVDDRFVLIESIDTVYAHSHGGNVALSAAAQGLEIELLVLLHVPPRSRPPAEWAAIRSNVKRTVVYRTALDPVVLADMIRDMFASGDAGRTVTQSFEQSWIPHEDTEPHPIRGPWMSHGFYTKLKNWTQMGIAADVVHLRNDPPMT